jgi:hypothetical protein
VATGALQGNSHLKAKQSPKRDIIMGRKKKTPVSSREHSRTEK